MEYNENGLHDSSVDADCVDVHLGDNVEHGDNCMDVDVDYKDCNSNDNESQGNNICDVPRGTIVIAATPIGNKFDASQRLLTLLAHADVIAAEDTRRLYDLARRCGVRVNATVIANHDHNERERAAMLLEHARNGACVVVVSDAGMPTINDPGLAIVREAIEADIPVTCAPGPSAVLDALALSGLPTDKFTFEGFLPRKHGERVQALQALLTEHRTMVFYETPHRIADAMNDLLAVFGANRRMALARELTKQYEQIRRGTVQSIADSVRNDPPRGEIVLVVAGASPDEIAQHTLPMATLEELAEITQRYAQEHQCKIKQAIVDICERYVLPDGTHPHRKALYNAILARKSS